MNISKKLPAPLEYYSHVHKRYKEIIELLSCDKFKSFNGIALDIDETILSDLSELPNEFIDFYNARNHPNLKFFRPKIPFSDWFVDSLINLDFKIYFVTARSEIHKERTIEDIKSFKYTKLFLKKEGSHVPTYKKYIRTKYNLIGIGDQLFDVDNTEFLIKNFYY